MVLEMPVFNSIMLYTRQILYYIDYRDVVSACYRLVHR